MISIGGFLELELAKKQEYYPDSISLNTARNCFEYILLSNHYKKVYLPYYLCDVLIEPLTRNDINYEFYYLNENFYPQNEIKLNTNEVLLYINYFGLMDSNVSVLSKKYNNIIIDNSQAFFSKPIENINTFYSPRKFFGVPDGGYLFCNDRMNLDIVRDKSANRLTHLIKRIEDGPEDAYPLYVLNEKKHSNQPIRRMSRLTKKILKSIDYDKVMRIRDNNFNFLHKYLGEYNAFPINFVSLNGPLVYPLLSEKKGLRELLITNKIFVATYWQNVIKTCVKDSLEYKFAKHIIPLPIDQRYEEEDMETIVKIIKKIIVNNRNRK